MSPFYKVGLHAWRLQPLEIVHTAGICMHLRDEATWQLFAAAANDGRKNRLSADALGGDTEEILRGLPRPPRL